MSAEKPIEQKKDTKLAQDQQWRTRPLGYPRLAERMGVVPTSLIFRQFSALNARMLLYMQAELVYLEGHLRRQEEKDISQTDSNPGRYATDYYHLMHSYEDGNTTQLDLIKKIQGKLEVYHRALLQQHKLYQISEPEKEDIDAIQALLYSKAMDSNALIGQDSEIWGAADNLKIYAPDLLGLYQRPRRDAFTRFVSKKAMRFSKFVVTRMLKRDVPTEFTFPTDTVTQWTGMITAVMASLLPVAAILVLSNLQSETVKLCTLAAFNVLLTVCLILCTEVKRSEVFAITAAFAAVQVVFLGTQRIDDQRPSAQPSTQKF